MKIIITGSEGLIGKELCKYLSKKNKIIKLDLVLGHDLSDEKDICLQRRRASRKEEQEEQVERNRRTTFPFCQDTRPNVQCPDKRGLFGDHWHIGERMRNKGWNEKESQASF